MTVLDLLRPFCLSPISTVGLPNEGASIIPLEELPTTTVAYFKADK